MSVAVDIAKRFAESLDAEDYQAAEAMLGEECEYTCRDRVYRGPSAIIDSYQCTGDSAKRDFDNIEYESVVKRLADNVARVHFIDHLHRAGEQFTFECQQVIEVGADGRIARIEHVDLPGQRESLSEFMRRVGAEKSNDGN